MKKANLPDLSTLNQSLKENLVGGTLVDSLDLISTAMALVHHFGERLDCQNVHWIDSESLAQLGLQQENPHPHHTLELSRMLISWKEGGEENQFGKAVKLIPQGEFRNLLAQPRALSWPDINKGKVHSLLPVHVGGGEVAYWILVRGLEQEGHLFVVRQMEETLKILARHLKFAYEHHEMLKRCYQDDLTKLYNHRYLLRVLDSEIILCKKHRQNFSLLFLDIDYFKHINDTHGHWFGSQALAQLGSVLKSTVRSGDFAFRYGGDEFVVMLSGASIPTACEVAERIRTTVESTPFILDGVKLNLTVSIGVASFPDHARTSEQIIRMADQAMYYGKNKSRNIVYLAS